MTTDYSLRAPFLVLFVLAGMGAASLAWSAQALPPQIASHFDVNGKPNAWMNRSDYLQSTGVIGLLIPMFFVGIGLLTRFLPNGCINLPHREYWLSAERRTDTNRYISRQMAWLACMAMAMLLSVHWLIVEANCAVPTVLSNVAWLVLIAFFGGVVIWVAVFIRHFSRPPFGTS